MLTRSVEQVSRFQIRPQSRLVHKYLRLEPGGSGALYIRQDIVEEQGPRRIDAGQLRDPREGGGVGFKSPDIVAQIGLDLGQPSLGGDDLAVPVDGVSIGKNQDTMMRGELLDQIEHRVVEDEVTAPVICKAVPVATVSYAISICLVQIGDRRARTPSGMFGEGFDPFERNARRAARRQPRVKYTVIVGYDNVAEIEDEGVDIAQARFSNSIALVKKALSVSTTVRSAAAKSAGRSVWL